MLSLTTKLMNSFSYSIITYFIPSNKDDLPVVILV